MARDDDDDDDDDRPIKKRRKPSSSGDNGLLGFLLFKKMIGPWLLIILYWLVVLGFLCNSPATPIGTG